MEIRAVMSIGDPIAARVGEEFKAHSHNCRFCSGQLHFHREI